MSHATKPISPLRQRMIEDMTLRKLSDRTQATYIRGVLRLTKYLGRSPDTASPEDLRSFQLHLAESGTSNITINATLAGLKFFFTHTLDRPEVLKHVQRVYEPRKLPEVLSTQEVRRLLDAAGSLRNKAALSVAYGAGLRASEVCQLCVNDVDSDREVIRVKDGKGRRDRDAMLSPSLVKILRAWYREGHAKRKILPGGWLFPGQNPVDPISPRQLNRVFHQAREDAGIDKKVSLHSLRHAFATHLLEQHYATDIVRSVRAPPLNTGSTSARPNCCQSSTTMWSSPCRHASPTLPCTTPSSSITCCSV